MGSWDKKRSLKNGGKFWLFYSFSETKGNRQVSRKRSNSGVHSVLHFFSDFTLFVGFIVRTEDLFNSRVPSAATWRYERVQIGRAHV